MTKARYYQPIAEAFRQPGSTNTGPVDVADVCQLLLAELQARRKRLRKLLRLVRMEVESLSAKRACAWSHARCENVRFRHTA
jgi:hypothetical protein